MISSFTNGWDLVTTLSQTCNFIFMMLFPDAVSRFFSLLQEERMQSNVIKNRYGLMLKQYYGMVCAVPAFQTEDYAGKGDVQSYIEVLEGIVIHIYAGII